MTHRKAGTTAPLSHEQQAAAGVRRVLLILAPQLREIDLEHECTTFGREETRSVRLEGDAVSRCHAEIQRRGEALAIVDTQSRHGTFVNAQRVNVGPLKDGDVVRLADHVGVVRERQGAGPSTPFAQLAPGLWGSEHLAGVLNYALALAVRDLPILLHGETGTGKEAFAAAIHARSARSQGPLVAVNCAALTESLLDAELFGHEAGAFTGAMRKRDGLLRAAHRGTLFLDEVAELSASAQAKLLRAVQEKKVVPVGARAFEDVDVRFVSATHKSLPAQVAAGAFREDLFHRLGVPCVVIPPLRARREDIPALFSLFVAEELGHVPSLGPLLVEALCLYPWPGNVRELQRLAALMVATHGHEPRWRYEQLPLELRTSPQAVQAVESDASRVPPRDLGESEVLAALREASGNVTRAAKLLGIARESLYSRIREWGIDLSVYR